jgi:hypothetical protein
VRDGADDARELVLGVECDHPRFNSETLETRATLHLVVNHDFSQAVSGSWRIVLSVDGIRLSNMNPNQPALRIETDQAMNVNPLNTFTLSPSGFSMLDGIAAVLNGIQASGVLLEVDNRMDGSPGLWVTGSRGVYGGAITIGATFTSSTTTTRVPRMWWRVYPDGTARWAFSANRRTPALKNAWSTMIPGNGISDQFDRNLYLITTYHVDNLRLDVPIFIAYTSASMPITGRLNGMVRFDEWLVHHLVGNSYASMLPNYGAQARLHPDLQGALTSIGLVLNTDFS